MKTTFIYTLSDPRTGEVRYLGKSDNPFARFKKHLIRAKISDTHKNCWILGLRGLGLIPHMELLDEVPDSEWQFWEQEYIRVFQAIGIRLVNGTDGGDGGATTRAKRLVLSDNERKRRSFFAINILPNLHRLPPGESKRRREEWSYQRRCVLRGGPPRPKSGFVCSEEHKQKVSAAKKLWWSKKKLQNV